MEGQVWFMIETLLSFVEGRPTRCRYHDRDILRVVLWATLKDRPIVWACQSENWPEDSSPACMPDPSTVSRRWRRWELQQAAYALHDRSVARLGAMGRYAALDGRPLPVVAKTRMRGAVDRPVGWVKAIRCMRLSTDET